MFRLSDEDFTRVMELYQWLLANPCKSGEEEPVERALKSFFEESGVSDFFDSSEYRGGGVVYRAKFGPIDGSTRAQRAEMDAVFKDGVVKHLCGHHGHFASMAAAALGCARLHRDGIQFPVQPVFIAESAEEKPPGGMRTLIDAGVLDDIDEIYAAHAYPLMPTGTFSARVGHCSGVAAAWNYEAEGVGGHAAGSHLLREPIYPMARAILVMEGLFREFLVGDGDPHQPWQHGGGGTGFVQAGHPEAVNVVPGKTAAGGVMGVYDDEVFAALQAEFDERMIQVNQDPDIIDKYSITPVYIPIVNDARAVELAGVASRLPSERFNANGPRLAFGESMGWTSQVENLKVCYMLAGCGGEKGDGAMNHSPSFKIQQPEKFVRELSQLMTSIMQQPLIK